MPSRCCQASSQSPLGATWRPVVGDPAHVLVGVCRWTATVLGSELCLPLPMHCGIVVPSSWGGMGVHLGKGADDMHAHHWLQEAAPDGLGL